MEKYKKYFVSFSSYSFQLIEFLSHFYKTPQPTIKCSKLTIETLEQGVKYVQGRVA